MRVVDVGFIEHHPLAIAPALLHPVHHDVAAIVVGRAQAQVQAQRTGEGIAVRAQFAARRQLREHRRTHIGNRFDQGHGLRAHRLGRRVRRAVPLQVEALPATAEERIEAGIVVAAGGGDLLRIAQRQRLVADHLPVLPQRLELRELLARVQERRGRHLREQIHDDVDRGHEAGVVQQLARPARADLAAVMDVQHAGHEQRCQDNLDDQNTFLQRAPDRETNDAAARPAPRGTRQGTGTCRVGAAADVAG